MKKIYIILYVCILGFHSKAQDFPNGVNYSPQSVIENFNYYQTQENYNLDLAAKSFPPEDRNKLEDVEKLKKVLDGRGILLTNLKVPNDPNYIDSTSQKQIYKLIPLEKRVYLEKINNQWYFSKKTIENIPILYEEVYKFNLEPDKYLKGKFWQKKFLGIDFATYTFLLLFFCLCYGLYWLISFIFSFFYKDYIKRRITVTPQIEYYIQKMGKALGLYLASVVFLKIIPSFQLSLGWNSFLIKSVGIISVVFLIYFINRMLDAIFYLNTHSHNNKKNKNSPVLSIINRIIKGIIWIIGILYIMYYYLDVNIVAIITGLSIGGLALALAAQDTVKNFIGSAVILLDKPFQVNDWIEYQDKEGKVEDIGLRSTRIRTYDDSLVYIPNSNISNNLINNKGFRRYKNFKTLIAIDYSTSIEKINTYIKDVENILLNHPKILNKKVYINIQELTESSIKIRISCFLKIDDSDEEFAIRHEILSQILTLAKKDDVHFALPYRHLYMDVDEKKINKEK